MTPLYWLISFCVLLMFEMLTMTTFFLFFALSSMILMVLSYLFNISNEIQIILASCLALISSLIWYKIYRYKNKKNATDNTNNRMANFNETIAVLLTEPNADNVSKIKIDSSFWRVKIQGKAVIGDKVIIIGSNSTTFLVKTL